MNAFNSSQQQWGLVAKALVILVCLIFSIGFIASAWSTQNPLFILGAIGAASIGLLQIGFIHNWFTDQVIPSLNRLDPHAGRVMNTTKRGARKVWELRTILLLFLILGFLMKDTTPIPTWIQDDFYIFSCIQNQVPPCGNGIAVTSLLVNESKGTQKSMSRMNIGIIDSTSNGPFNQYDAHNDHIERNLEKTIFTENFRYPGKPYVTLAVATALSQTVTDPSLSVNIGLDELRGAYMAQYNFNRDPSQRFKLRLLIANFGTKATAFQTVPLVMKQIKLYANSDSQHFIGIVGFPFSTSAIPALDARSQLPGDDFPIIASASADYLSDLSHTPPNNWYANFYRIIAPISKESKVLADFVENELPSTAPQTLLFEDRGESYSQSLGSQAYSDLGVKNTAYYTEGEPDTLDAGINEIIHHHYNQLFFSGFADDLNALRNKLTISRMNGTITWNIRIIGGEGLYDLGSYSNGNYANLFFTINATYAQINQDISLQGIQVPENQSCPSQSVGPFTSHFNDEFCHLFNQKNAPNLYGYQLAGTHVLLMYDAVEAFLQALPQEQMLSSPLWQTIIQNLPTVQFQGVTGKIQFSQSNMNTVNNPINKPVYVACTDRNGYTHAVGEYEINDTSFSYRPNGDELHVCLTGE